MTLKRPKDKGTKGETELVGYLDEMGIIVRRTPPGTKWDLETPMKHADATPINALAIRPDRGKWLVTVSLSDFVALFYGLRYRPDLRIEVKRWATSRIHTVWKEKFGE